MKEKTPLLHKFVCFQMPENSFKSLSDSIVLVRNNLVLKNYHYFGAEGVISQNVLYYHQQLSIVNEQVCFTQIYSFELLQNMSSAL